MDSKKWQDIMKKVSEMKKSGTADLSLEEDLSIAVMNLVSLEEHFFLTAEKTQKSDYLDLLRETRELRKELLGRMVNRHEGETWCITKHLLAATMRVMEVATKLLGDGKKKEAEDMFNKAYRIYSLFWAVRLKLLNLEDVKKIGDQDLNIHDKPPSDKNKEAWDVEDIMKKLVNCCDE